MQGRRVSSFFQKTKKNPAPRGDVEGKIMPTLRESVISSPTATDGSDVLVAMGMSTHPSDFSSSSRRLSPQLHWVFLLPLPLLQMRRS